jgi:hypothetical protein
MALRTGSAPSRSTQRALGVALRVVVGVVVVGLLFVRADLRDLADLLADVRTGYVAAAFGVVLVGLVVNALRWQAFLRPIGVDLPLSSLVRLTFIGTFFNAFLPTGFGGDAYKSFRLRGEAGSMAPPLATVFLDRLVGLVGLALLALGGSAIRLAAGDHTGPTVAAALVSIGVLAVWVLSLWIAPRWAPDEASPAGSSGASSRLRVFAGAFAKAGREPAAARRGTVIGVASAALLVVVFALLVASLHLAVPAAALPGIVLLASVVAAVPLTVNGLGFREAALVWCLGAYGIGHEQALAFGLLLLGVTLASSATGGIVYAVSGGAIAGRREPAARAR